MDFFETFSPVVKPSTIKVIFTLAVTFGWDIQQVDVNNAFLNGVLTEEVYTYQPEGYEDPTKPDHICKLHKALYGLKQAPRAWYAQLSTTLLDWGFVNSVSDSSLFIYKRDTQCLYLLVYVDDILITGNSPELINKAIRDEGGISLTQSKYLRELLHKTNMSDSSPCSTPMCPSTKLQKQGGDPFAHVSLYRSTLRSL